MLVSLQTGEIIALAFSNGKRHDFQLFKDSRAHVKAETVLEADTGYQGIAQIHANPLRQKSVPRIIRCPNKNAKITARFQENVSWLNTPSALSKGFVFSLNAIATAGIVSRFAFL